MRRLALALMLPAICLSVHAEQTGRISGKVLNKEGKPIPGSKVNLKRVDRNWSKDLIPDKNGNFLQVGLEPKDFTMTVTAEGYVTYTESPVKIPLADVIVKNITLLTPAEARTQALTAGGQQASSEDPGASLDIAGRDAFNSAIPLYNEGKYEEALPLVDKAFKTLTEAKDKLKDDQAKADLAPELLKIERVLGICIAQAGSKKEEAEPYLLKALERNPKDERVILGLIETSKAKADKAAEQKYTTLLETLQGPNPDLIYNKGVEAFNAGKTKEAKAHLTKALEVDPKYAEAHFLLAMVEFGENNLKGTKHNLQKYVELAPNGKNAATAKDMLKDPSLKNIK
ncbi:MAG: carboxypeptidase regulatory-like domain-containing protein [Geothrix sp.]|uniref:carboxypeptidase regulatory-like domain-containing protein n=1 Tax=Geothrix sp. TaxID=1962974 RepID=UPI0017F3F7A1|nr:carboxypeptidase regulatory-like domain-containing protein [Geothrix sp.]NWJ39683.1 carboxypeptidase regulatory-like domain-containing protein [Geothrix sp.]WIL22298.1 MAG: carboxypeptidase regulatory-like domain-containing protein [Geothrix sp.]